MAKPKKIFIRTWFYGFWRWFWLRKYKKEHMKNKKNLTAGEDGESIANEELDKENIDDNSKDIENDEKSKKIEEKITKTGL